MDCGWCAWKTWIRPGRKPAPRSASSPAWKPTGCTGMARSCGRANAARPMPRPWTNSIATTTCSAATAPGSCWGRAAPVAAAAGSARRHSANRLLSGCQFPPIAASALSTACRGSGISRWVRKSPISWSSARMAWMPTSWPWWWTTPGRGSPTSCAAPTCWTPPAARSSCSSCCRRPPPPTATCR